MNISKHGTHKPAKHLREPVIDPRKHAEHRRDPHHKMKMRHHKVGVVEVYINGRITQPDPCQPTGDKGAYEPDAKQHPRSEPDITPPKRGDPVKYLDRRWNC